MENEKLRKIWDILVGVAKSGKTITYSDLGRMITTPAIEVGNFLYPIQNYCAGNGLPPLTILVVQKATGRPGKGILYVVTEAEIPQKTVEVQNFDWSGIANPHWEKSIES